TTNVLLQHSSITTYCCTTLCQTLFNIISIQLQRLPSHLFTLLPYTTLFRSVLPGEQQLLIYGSFRRGCFTRPIDGGPRVSDSWCNFIDRLEVDNHHAVILCLLFPFLGQFRSDLRVLRVEVLGLPRVSGTL